MDLYSFRTDNSPHYAAAALCIQSTLRVKSDVRWMLSADRSNSAMPITALARQHQVYRTADSQALFVVNGSAVRTRLYSTPNLKHIYVQRCKDEIPPTWDSSDRTRVGANHDRTCRSYDCSRSHSRLPRGFTLVELLVVIAIVGVLIGLLLPAVQAARESSRRSRCQNNLRQIGIAVLNYESQHQRFPPGKRWSRPRNDPQTFDYSWSSILLDYVEEQALHDQIDFSLPLTDPVNLPATSRALPIYLCPSTSRIEEHRSYDGQLINLDGQPGEGLGCIDYLGISGPDKDKKNPATGLDYGRQRGVLLGTKGLPNGNQLTEPPAVTASKIVDGLSNTICIVECTGRGADVKKSGEIKSLNGAWASGSNISHIDKGVNSEQPPKVWEDERIFSDHPAGANTLTCDGSVQFLLNDVEPKVIRSLCSRDGEERIEPPPF